MIKGIIFDLGGVLVDFHMDRDYYPYLEKLTGKSLDELKKVFETKYLVEFEKGLISYKEFRNFIKNELNIKERDIKWVTFPGYKEKLKFIDSMNELVDKLHNKYKIAVLSNIDAPRYKLFRPLIKSIHYDYLFLSFKLHMRKPEKEIYEYVLSKMKITKDEAIFIDDRKENIEGAIACGIDSILFTSKEALLEELKKRNIEIS